MTKELIIITLIIVVIYLYYQQNNQPLLADNSSEITRLEQEVKHYQNLYQSRVEKDLFNETKFKELQNTKQSLEKQIQALTLLATDRQKRLAQEQKALIALAQQKLTKKKEFQAFLTQRENSWQEEKANLTKEQSQITKQKDYYQKLAEQELTDKKKTQQQLIQKEKDWQRIQDNWTAQKKQFNQDKEKLETEIKTQQQTNQELRSDISQQVQEAQGLKKELSLSQQAIKNKEKVIGDLNQSKKRLGEEKIQLTQELKRKQDWRDDQLPQLKQELFTSAQQVYQELKDTVQAAYFMKGKGEVQSKLEQLDRFLNFPVSQATTTLQTTITNLENQLNTKQTELEQLKANHPAQTELKDIESLITNLLQNIQQLNNSLK